MNSGAVRGWFGQSIEQWAAAPCRSRFSIGAVSVEVTGACIDDVRLVPSLCPFGVENGDAEADIEIRVQWVDTFAPTMAHLLFDSGTTWRLYEDQAGFQFHITAPMFGQKPYKKLVVDRGFQRATLLMSEESFASFPCVVRPLEYPLDELLIMHRLTQEKAIELHSCGMVTRDGGGNLFVGHSGAGKSTTTQLWTEREEVEVLSDDRIIVRRDTGRRSGLEARRMRMYGTPWHGDAMYASPASAPLSRILILEHGIGNVLTRLAPGQAVAELFARSFVPFHSHEYVASALEFLQELVAEVPCYRFASEPNESAVERILQLRD